MAPPKKMHLSLFFFSMSFLLIFFFFLPGMSFLLMVYETSSQTPQPQPIPTSTTKHFVLVHGACHGAWSWYKLVPLLRSSGHNVTTIELAASGIDPQQTSNLTSVSDYIKPLRDFMSSLPPQERVILVGHSLGGFAVPQAMERFPNKISVAVFLTAFMPSPSLNISTLYQELSRRQVPQLDNHYTYDDGPNNLPTTILFGPVFLSLRMYQLSPIQDWTLATTLMRPTRIMYEDTSRELKLTMKNYGSVKRVFILAEKDLTFQKNFQQWIIQKNPPNEVEEILGSDHMSMMSKPGELCSHLLAIARKYD